MYMLCKGTLASLPSPRSCKDFAINEGQRKIPSGKNNKIGQPLKYSELFPEPNGVSSSAASEIILLLDYVVTLCANQRLTFALRSSRKRSGRKRGFDLYIHGSHSREERGEVARTAFLQIVSFDEEMKLGINIFWMKHQWNSKLWSLEPASQRGCDD